MTEEHPFGAVEDVVEQSSPYGDPLDGYTPHRQWVRLANGKSVPRDWIRDPQEGRTMTMTTLVTPPIPSVPVPPMGVYECIVGVSREIAQQGISKTRNNAQQGYKFRGIDDVLNALSPLLAKYRLVILPRVLSRTVVERETRNGGVLFYVTVECEFDFVSAADGSQHTVKTYGEAMDSADKATNKAMSAAYKYAAFQTFCIPTEGDNDADAVTHEPVIQIRQTPAAARVAVVPRVDPSVGASDARPSGAEVLEGAARPSGSTAAVDFELPPGFALIDDIKEDGKFLQVYWGRDAKGGWRHVSTKKPEVVQQAWAAFNERVPVKLHSKDGKYLDKVERLDGGMSKADLAATKWTPEQLENQSL